MVTSTFRAVRAGGLAAGIALALSLSGGVASAEPDTNTGTSSTGASGAGGSTGTGTDDGDSTGTGSTSDGPTSKLGGDPTDASTNSGSDTGSTSDAGGAPTSKLGSDPTDGLTSSGGAQTSDAFREQEDALVADMSELERLTAQVSQFSEEQKQLLWESEKGCKYGALGCGEAISITDMLAMQNTLDHLKMTSEMSSAVIAQTQSDLDALARAEKGG